MGTGIDKNIKGMEKGRAKIAKLMKETSNCCLIITIILELALMILMLIYLWKKFWMINFKYHINNIFIIFLYKIKISKKL